MGAIQTAGTVVTLKDGRTRRLRSKLERRQIVEETLKPGASVSLVARSHDVNTNQVFKWRRQYGEGRLEIEQTSGPLVPVKVSDAIQKLRPASRRKSLEGDPHHATFERQSVGFPCACFRPFIDSLL